MNTQSNTYTFLYSVVLVVVVATLLAVISLSLKDRQNANIRNEKMQNILSSANIDVPADKAAAEFEKYIKEQFIVNSRGEKMDGEAFNVNIAKEFEKAPSERQLPVFVADVNGARKYILPLYGKGLWGAIWGYISLNDDKNTVYGIFFDHAGETPGLGAEITNKGKFRSHFEGKKVMDNGTRILKVSKGASAKGRGDHEVDALSGGTLTSNGVEAMLGEYVEAYKLFLSKQVNN